MHAFSISEVLSLRFLQRCFFGLGLLFFFLMLVIPTTFQAERGVLLAVLMFGGLCYALNGGWRIHPVILGWGLCTATASLLFMLLGAINGAPGAFRVGTIYVLWPMIFLFLMGVVKVPKQLSYFFKIIAIGAVAVAVMAFALVADRVLGLGLGMSSLLESQGAGLGIYDGFVEYQLFNMTTAIYALPFLLGVLFIPKTFSPFKGGWRAFAWLALALSILTLLISGRRAFWFTAALSPFIVVILLWLSGINANVLKNLSKGLAIGVLAVLLVVPALSLDLQMIMQDFFRGFDFNDADNISAYYRREQFFALTEGWTKTPLFGAGHGSFAAGSVRSEGQPWAYELSYLALLYQTGIAGVLIYGAAVAWVFYKGVKVMRSVPESAGFLIPTLSALACFLVANATNPYLQKFDYLWAIFLPVAVLNAFMIRSRR